jgi:hypothetical protein
VAHFVGDLEAVEAIIATFEALKTVYRRFSEGFDTADLQAAKALLGELG